MLTKSTEKLKEMIREHPDYPIVVLVGEEANTGDYPLMYCTDISFSVQRILDREVPWTDCVQTDANDFEEGLEDWLWDKMTDELDDPEAEPDEDEFLSRLVDERAKYEQSWVDVIAITVEN